MAEKLIFEKIVDKSALSDGITVPMACHETLNSHLSGRLKYGESMPIQLRMNGTSYTVQLRNLYDFYTGQPEDEQYFLGSIVL